LRSTPLKFSSPTVASDGNGAFTVRGLEAGSYTLTFTPCPHEDKKNYDVTKSNGVTRFAMDNLDVKDISVPISNTLCATSEGMPLRAIKTPQGSLV